MYIASYRHLEAPINICRWKMALTAFFFVKPPFAPAPHQKILGVSPEPGPSSASRRWIPHVTALRKRIKEVWL